MAWLPKLSLTATVAVHKEFSMQWFYDGNTAFCWLLSRECLCGFPLIIFYGEDSSWNVQYFLYFERMWSMWPHSGRKNREAICLVQTPLWVPPVCPAVRICNADVINFIHMPQHRFSWVSLAKPWTDGVISLLKFYLVSIN